MANINLSEKIAYGLGRISDVYKSLLWQQAKLHGISPIQIQILIYVEHNSPENCNVSNLAKVFQVTKPTISDAIRVLINKDYLLKDHSPTDSRRYNVVLTTKGNDLVKELSAYDQPIKSLFADYPEEKQLEIYQMLVQAVTQMNDAGIIQVQQNCFSCKFYSRDKSASHYCNLMQKPLEQGDIRLNCADHEVAEAKL